MSKPPRTPILFRAKTGGQWFLESDLGDLRYAPVQPDPEREYRSGMWAGLVLGLTIGASLVGFALLVGIGIGGSL